MQIFVICTLLLVTVWCKSNPNEPVKLGLLGKIARFFGGGKSKTAPTSTTSKSPVTTMGDDLDPGRKKAETPASSASLKSPVGAASQKSQSVPSLEKNRLGAVAQQPATSSSSSKQEDDKKGTKPPVEPSKDATSGSDKKPDEEAKESSDKKGSQSAGNDAGKPVGYKFDKLIEDVSQFYNCQNANEPM